MRTATLPITAAGNVAVALGDTADANNQGTNKNIATAVGDASAAQIVGGSKNTATALGFDASVTARGDHNHAVATDSGGAQTFGDHNVAVAKGPACFITATGSHQVAHCP